MGKNAIINKFEEIRKFNKQFSPEELRSKIEKDLNIKFCSKEQPLLVKYIRDLTKINEWEKL